MNDFDINLFLDDYEKTNSTGLNTFPGTDFYFSSSKVQARDRLKSLGIRKVTSNRDLFVKPISKNKRTLAR